jgi:hypothetical protein
MVDQSLGAFSKAPANFWVNNVVCAIVNSYMIPTSGGLSTVLIPRKPDNDQKATKLVFSRMDRIGFDPERRLTASRIRATSEHAGRTNRGPQQECPGTTTASADSRTVRIGAHRLSRRLHFWHCLVGAGGDWGFGRAVDVFRSFSGFVSCRGFQVRGVDHAIWRYCSMGVRGKEASTKEDRTTAEPHNPIGKNDRSSALIIWFDAYRKDESA